MMVVSHKTNIKNRMPESAVPLTESEWAELGYCHNNTSSVGEN